MCSVGEIRNMELCYELWLSKISVLRNLFRDLMNITVLLKGYVLTIFLVSDKLSDGSNLGERFILGS